MNASNRVIPAIPALSMPARLALVLLAAAASLLAPVSGRADDLKDARAALAAGDLDQAQKLFEKVSSQGFAEGRAGVGQVYLRRHDLAKAKDAFEAAQKMDGNLALAWYGLGEVDRRQGNCDQAVASLQKAVEIDRKFPDAQLALGDCLVQTKRYAEAIQALNPGLNWGPKWKPRFLVALGQVEMARDSLRDAGIYFTQAQQEAPQDPQTNRALGDFYLKRGIGALAIPSYQTAVTLDSSDVELHFALGQALYYDQRYNDALEQYKWVAAKDPDFPPGQLALGNLYYLSGPADPHRYADARPYLEKYTQLMPTDVKGWSLLGRDYYFLKMKDEAVTALSKAASMGDKSKEMYTVLARAYVDKKDWPNALAAYEKGEPNTQDLFKIGQMQVFLGNLGRADSVYQTMIDKDSTSNDAKFAMVEQGKLKFRQKDYPGTIQAMQRRNGLDPKSDEAYYYLGLSYNALKQVPEALTALRTAATLAPNKADRQFWLGLVLASADSIPEANAAFQRSVELDSTSASAALAFQQLGYRQLLAKDWGRAIDFLVRSATVNDKDVHTLVWLGQGYQNSGNKVKAAETYRKVLQLDPSNADAQKGLKGLAP